MKLRRGDVCGAKLIALLLVIVAFCLFECTLQRQSRIFREYAAAVLSLQWILLACIAVWCATLLVLAFAWSDWPYVGLLLAAVTAGFSGDMNRPIADVLVLTFGATLGKGVGFALKGAKITNQKSAVRIFLVGLIALLAFASLWHLDMSKNYYHGIRWMGLWNNPNIYGMLMSAGLVLAIGLIVADRKRIRSRGLKVANAGCQNIVQKSMLPLLQMLLFVAVAMTGLGLVCSYSRGAWLGATVGLLYLEGVYVKIKWRFMLPGILLVVTLVWCFWGATADSAPWYLKRLDLSRASVQHRVAAWRGAAQIMWDHPFGVGWNNVVAVYGEKYSPPEGGAAAITTNDYLMLGTQLGVPALACFVAYAGLAFGRNRPHVARKLGMSDGIPGEPAMETFALRCACRAGALAMLVAFWFDGGLFTLATATVFWILLELGNVPDPRTAGILDNTKNLDSKRFME